MNMYMYVGRLQLINELQDILAVSLECATETDLMSALPKPVSRPVNSFRLHLHVLQVHVPA